VDVPIIGSGDLFTPMDCKRMIEETDCDAVMMARGTRGAPWRIGLALDLIEGRGPSPSPSLEERLKVLRSLGRGMLDYFNKTSERYGLPDDDNHGKTLRDMRKFVHWFFKGYPKWLLDRDGLLKLATLEELDEFLEKALNRYEEHSLA
jgi:tRNA-dihydrouridine synthase